MKNIIFIALLSLFIVASCNNAQSESHTHDDGTTHSDCGQEHSNDSNHQQEVFDVEADSTHDCGDDAISEGKEHEHTHQGSTEHNH